MDENEGRHEHQRVECHLLEWSVGARSPPFPSFSEALIYKKKSSPPKVILETQS
jgi:hypothetical protein